MDRIDLENDIRPLSEFRANTASLVTQVRKTGRPLVLTQHGKSAVVLLDVRLYQSMLSACDRLPGSQEFVALPGKMKGGDR
ncbi:MAG: type II toxin-antitoxin system Phd/YefM family antitoxin [Chlorobiaceae bacterium]|nr:type II toxin-antitoxin system Phd/YefM family antitoxin [Chlorobiaceae bacterium]